MNARNAPFPYGFPKPFLWGIAGAIAGLGFLVWHAARAEPEGTASSRDPELLEWLLTEAPGEQVSDERVYEDRASARAAARAYREACRWRGLTYHYRIEPVPDGFMWYGWTTLRDELPADEEAADD